MKTEKMFVGSLAIVISALASGCAGTTLSTGHAVELGASTPMIAAGPGQMASWEPPRGAQVADAPSHGTARTTTMSLRATQGRSR
jgi:hypothetical protein